jgi:hypothetical protein
VPSPKREARLPPRNRGARRAGGREEEAEVPPPKREARLPPPNRVLGAAPPRAQEGENSMRAAARPRRVDLRAPPAALEEATMRVFVYEQATR